MDFGRVDKDKFSIKELLEPLDENEQAFFLTCLKKLNDKDNIDKQALCVLLVDRLHDNHTEELATITSVLVNKFMGEPFLRDREMLKRTLEAIMGAIDMAENMMDDDNG